MDTTREALQSLVRQMSAGDVSSRIELEAKLAQLLRLVLQTGQGSASLLRWVRSALPAGNFDGKADPNGAARNLARLLCLQLRKDVRAQRDTVIDRRSVVA